MTDSPGSPSRLFAGAFPAIEERLLSRLPDRIARINGATDREFVLLVPSNDLREHLLKRLAAGWQGYAAGSRILTLYDFAVLLLRHRGSHPVELPPAQAAAALSAAVREVYSGGRGDFAAIAGTPGFLPALAQTLGDLEEGWLTEETFRLAEVRAARGETGRLPDRWREWRHLVRAVDRKVRALGGMSRRRIFQEAVAGFEQPGYPYRVTLYGFYDFTRLQWTLVEALLGSGLLDEVYYPCLFSADGSPAPAFAYAGVTWERLLRAFEGNVEHLSDAPAPEIAAVREELFSPRPGRRGAQVPFDLLSAPHGEGEMRLAARYVRRLREEHPGDDVAVVARNLPEESLATWERMAAEYGIRTVRRLCVPLSSVPLVRVLLQMIAAAAEDLPRRAVIDIVSSPYRRLATTGADPPSRPEVWEALTRELSVVSGADWDRRLVRLRPRDPEGEEGEDATARERQLELLREEVAALRRSLRPLTEAGSYAEMSRAVRELLLADFVFVDDDGDEAERDRRALSALLSLVADVERIPEREVPWPGAAGALAWFSGLLARHELFLGERAGMRVPGAVVAGSLAALRGVTADRFVFLTVNEDAVPAQLEEDPLLPDEDREALNRLTAQAGLPPALSLRRRNAAEERLLFALPAASARKSVTFSVLRADAGGSVMRPSRYLLDLLSRFSGPDVFAEDWESASGAPVLRLPRSPFAALEGPGGLSAREEALRAWRAGGALPEGDGDVPRGRILGVLSAWERRRGGASVFPCGPPPLSPPGLYSASELDELAMCPYRYFLRYRLRFAPVEEPEETLSLSAAETGVLLHDILRRLGREASEGKGWGDVAPAARAAVRRLAAESPTGLPGLFRLQCRNVERDAAAYAERERARFAGPGAPRVEAVELAFRVEGREGIPALRGRVDRADRYPDGAVEIVDYKYRDGKNEKPPVDRIRHGLSHQVPVYLVFAEALEPAPPSVRASLHFLKREIRFVTVDARDWAELREEWAASLADWLRVAEGGCLPPLPHHRFSFAGAKPPRYCNGCPFRDHCRVSPAYDGSECEGAPLMAAVAREARLRDMLEHRPETPS